MKGSRSTTRPALRGHFWLLWSATAISTLGDGVRLAALPLLAATVSRDPVAVAAVAFAGQLPWLLLSLPSGVLVDRSDRRVAMWTADALRALLMAGLVYLIARDAVGIAVLCALSFLIGAGQTVFDNASHALLPSLVDKSALPGANSWLATARVAINGFLGPPIGSGLFAVAAVAPFVLDATSFALAAVLVAVGLRTATTRTAAAPDRRSSVLADMKQGITWVAQHTAVRNIALIVAVVNLTQSATQSVLVLFALEELHLEASGFGLLLAAAGVGGLAGGLLGAPLRRRVGAGRIFAAAVIVTVPIFMLLAVTSNAYLAAAALAANAFAGINAGVLMSSGRQALVPEELRGRVNSVVGMLGIGLGLPAGALLGGFLAQGFGLQAPFWAAAALIALTVPLVPSVGRSLERAFAPGPR